MDQVIYLALKASERPVTVQEIARDYAISANHVAKVAQTLSQLGYVKSLRGRGGADEIDGGSGEDTVDYSGAALGINVDLQNELAANDGDGSSDVLRNIQHVIGSDSDDVIRGDTFVNNLSGGLGSDILAGGAGGDTLDGGAGAGVDTADYSDAAGSIDVNLGLNTAADDGDGSVDTLIDIENVAGSAFDDLITGDAGANLLQGADGNDTFNASLGDDTLEGGDDTDTADYSGLAGAPSIDVTLRGGSDATVIVSGGGGTDTLRSIENIVATAGDDTLRGDGNDNVLNGGDGDDVIWGGGGSDASSDADRAKAGGQLNEPKERARLGLHQLGLFRPIRPDPPQSLHHRHGDGEEHNQHRHGDLRSQAVPQPDDKQWRDGEHGDGLAGQQQRPDPAFRPGRLPDQDTGAEAGSKANDQRQHNFDCGDQPVLQIQLAAHSCLHQYRQNQSLQMN